MILGEFGGRTMNVPSPSQRHMIASSDFRGIQLKTTWSTLITNPRTDDAAIKDCYTTIPSVSLGDRNISTCPGCSKSSPISVLIPQEPGRNTPLVPAGADLWPGRNQDPLHCSPQHREHINPNLAKILQQTAQAHEWKWLTHPEGPVPVTCDVCHAGRQDVTKTTVRNRRGSSAGANELMLAETMCLTS